MKIAATLFILSVCYIASTEQAQIAAPVGVRRSFQEMQHKAQQGMNIKTMFENNPRAKAQFDVPTNPQELYECANKDCPGSKDS